jgi:hypothetical protein
MAVDPRVGVGARAHALGWLCVTAALAVASCEEREVRSRRASPPSATVSMVKKPPSVPPLRAAPSASSDRRAGGPALAALQISEIPSSFTYSFLHPDEFEISSEPGSCRIFASGTLGRAPVRATLDAVGRNLTLELRIVSTSEKIVYRGELAADPCVDEIKDDAGTLHLVGRSRHSPKLSVSIERRRATVRTSVKGWTRADDVLELSEIAPALRSTYDALAKPLFRHERGAVRIEYAIDDGKGTMLVAYQLPSGQLKLAELDTASRAVRRSIRTAMTCKTRDCESTITAFRPRPGTAVIVAANIDFVCTSSCTGTREVELWTLGPGGFLSGGVIPPMHEPSDPRDRERLMSLEWVHVDGRSQLGLVVASYLGSGVPSKLWLFTCDPRLRRCALDPRPLEPTPDVLAALSGGVIHGIW